MSDKNTHNDHLTADQLKAYATGNMTDGEMHVVERHLLDCGLCSEALEGVAGAQHVKYGFRDDVESLKTRIQNHAAEKRGGMRPWKPLRMAATILVIIGVGGFLIYQLGVKPNAPEDIAENRAEHLDSTSKDKPLVKADKQAELDERAKETDRAESKIKKGPTHGDDLLLAAHDARRKGLRQKPPPPVEMEATGQAPSTSADKDGPELLAGKVVNERGEAIPDANVLLQGTDQKVSTDESGAFTISGAGDSAVLNVTRPGMMAQNITVTGNEPVTIKLKEQEELAANEISAVETKAGSAKQFSGAAKSVADTGPAPKKAEPVGGFEAFNKYINESREYPRKARRNDITGTVMVSFRIQQDGSLTEFKIEQGLGYGCDEEAIRLLKSGPKWKPGEPGKRKTVSIQFQ